MEFQRLSIVLLLVLCSSIGVYSEKQLRVIAAFHRHGDRSPTVFCNTDPYRDESYWPDGIEMLTKKGKQRMYRVGLTLRDRYQEVLSFSPRELYARSSSRERCLESAIQVANGFYQPVDRWIWNETQDWQPIAIHTVPVETDSMLFHDSDCPARLKIADERENSAVVNDLKAAHPEIMTAMKENCSNYEPTLLKLGDLSDTFILERRENYTPPSWVTEEIEDGLFEFETLAYEIRCVGHEELSLITGVFAADLKEHLTQAALNESYVYKTKLYSSHDIMLSCVLRLMDAFNHIRPMYGATLIWELWSTGNGSSVVNKTADDKSSLRNFIVRLNYLNDTDRMTVAPLKMAFCPSEDCPLDVVVAHLDKYILPDWKAACALTLERSMSSTVVAVIATFGAVCLLCLLLFIITRCTRRQRWEYQIVSDK